MNIMTLTMNPNNTKPKINSNETIILAPKPERVNNTIPPKSNIPNIRNNSPVNRSLNKSPIKNIRSNPIKNYPYKQVSPVENRKTLKTSKDSNNNESVIHVFLSDGRKMPNWCINSCTVKMDDKNNTIDVFTVGLDKCIYDSYLSVNDLPENYRTVEFDSKFIGSDENSNYFLTHIIVHFDPDLIDDIFKDNKNNIQNNIQETSTTRADFSVTNMVEYNDYINNNTACNHVLFFIEVISKKTERKIGTKTIGCRIELQPIIQYYN